MKHIAQNTKVQLGLIIAILTFCAPPIYKAFATIDVHTTEIGSLKEEVKKIDKMADDVSYIKGVIETEQKLKRRGN